jgi:hypothetical protein
MKRIAKIPRFLLTIVLAISLLLLPNYGLQVIAESAADPAPVIQPLNPNGKSVLFDNTHAQTAGAADWVIDGAFSDYAQGLASQGYYVKELRKNTPITLEDLSAYNVFIIPEANIPLKASEQSALLTYVENGGSIFFISDHYNADRNKNRWDASEVFNGYRRGAYNNPALGMNAEEASSDEMTGIQSSDWLANNFGVRFRYNAAGDITANTIVSPTDTFGITQNINSVAMHAGSTIAILNPQLAKGIVYLPEGLTTANKWANAVDQGIYNAGGIDEGAYIAIAKKGLGKAAFIGDSSAVEDATPKYLKEETGQSKTTYAGYSEQNDALLLTQLTNWLALQENYTNFTQTSINLDTATSLYDFETPALSTEPQAEPWAQPASNYKWYDSSTFAAGSYGAVTPTDPGDPPNQPYFFNIPDKIIVNQELPLTIQFSNLTPNSTLSNISVGAYLDGGTQIGLFKELNGVWPTTYGYSATFSVTANATGNATKTLVFKLKSGVSGSFNLRLKQNGTNMLTESLTIIQESGDLPPQGTPVYTIFKPKYIKHGQELALTVRVSNLYSGGTASNLRVGMYVDGGTQIGLFSADNGTWPSAYGYSGYFSLTADSSGKASKTFIFKVNDGVVGAAYERIKSNSSNVLTEGITIIE